MDIEIVAVQYFQYRTVLSNLSYKREFCDLLYHNLIPIAPNDNPMLGTIHAAPSLA